MFSSFRTLLTSGKKFAGTILQFYSPEIIEILTAAGYDYVIIDNEHSCATYEQTLTMLRTADSVGIPASASLGVPGQTFHPLVEKAIRDVSDLCIKYGKCSGIYIEHPQQAADYKNCAGITHFLTKTPESILLEGYRSFHEGIMNSL